MTILKNIPFEQWSETCHYNNTFLHFACLGKNIEAVVALIIHGTIDIDALNMKKNTASFLAAINNEPCMLEILLAAGTKRNFSLVRYHASNHCGSYTDEMDTVKVLLANGFRTRDMRHCTLGHQSFEQGVLRCRDVIVTLLGLKKRRQHDGRSLVLPKLDRFLVKEVLAVEIWLTRSCENEKWQQ